MPKPPRNNVVRFTGSTVLSYPPEQFLRQLADVAEESKNFETVLVIVMRKTSAPTIHASTMDDERNLALAHLAASYLTTRYGATLYQGFGSDEEPPPPPPSSVA